MAEGNWSVVRVEKISAEGAQKTERHNERKNESYANLNVDTEQIARNVHFKDTGGLTYNEYFQRLIDEGKISTRGQKAGATVFNELVIDVNTRYFEEHGGYEYAPSGSTRKPTASAVRFTARRTSCRRLCTPMKSTRRCPKNWASRSTTTTCAL